MDVFAALRQIRTPIVYDTIERLNLRTRSQGYLDTSIKCMLPSLGAIVGYACTGKIAAELAYGEGLPAHAKSAEYRL